MGRVLGVIYGDNIASGLAHSDAQRVGFGAWAASGDSDQMESAIAQSAVEAGLDCRLCAVIIGFANHENLKTITGVIEARQGMHKSGNTLCLIV